MPCAFGLGERACEPGPKPDERDIVESSGLDMRLKGDAGDDGSLGSVMACCVKADIGRSIDRRGASRAMVIEGEFVVVVVVVVVAVEVVSLAAVSVGSVLGVRVARQDRRETTR